MVFAVPQCASHLLSVHGDSLVGQPLAAVEPYLGPPHRCPHWHQYHPRRDPQWGTGLLVVRDGVLRRGPTNWDSSD